MTDALQSYQFDNEPVRVVMIAGDPWFIANDVAKVLGYTQAAFMTRLLDEDEAGLHIVQTSSQQREMSIISESGLYHAAIKRRGKEAQRFRKWVTAEVLPSIRKTGRYVLHEPPAAPPLALMMDTDPARLNASVALIREARRLFGPKTARELWVRMGLPVAIVEAKANQIGDALAEPLRQYLTGRTICTSFGAAQGIGIAEPSASDQQRIAALLRLFGWEPKAQRIGGKKENGWTAPTPQPWHGTVTEESGE